MSNLQFVYNDEYRVVYHGQIVSVSLCGVSAILDKSTQTISLYIDDKLSRVDYVDTLPSPNEIVDHLVNVVDHCVDLS